MAAKKTKETNRDKGYMQALKADKAVRNSEGKSPSFSTRERTSVVQRRKYTSAKNSPYANSTLKNVAFLLTRKYTENEKAQRKVEKSFVKQSKAEDADMARRRRLLAAKKNVNKGAK